MYEIKKTGVSHFGIFHTTQFWKFIIQISVSTDWHRDAFYIYLCFKIMFMNGVQQWL
jgi:hypothetical protein